MAREVFDQTRFNREKARLFAEAFQGCDQWTVPPRKPRRSTSRVYDFQSRYRSDEPEGFRRAA